MLRVKHSNLLSTCFHFKNIFNSHKKCSTLSNMELPVVLRALEKLAPLKLAASWDNVGLLLEPSSPHTVKNILLTNDLTEAVMQESIDSHTDLIISYHPPIFKPLTRVTANSWKQRLVVKALENRIAVYSPHTACDAVKNGVNDWLAEGLGELSGVEPIELSTSKSPGKLVKLAIPESSMSKELVEKLNSLFSNLQIVEKREKETKMEFLCKNSEIKSLLKEIDPQLLNNLQMTDLSPVPLVGTGPGRVCRLSTPTNIKNVIDNLKRHLSLPFVRVALGEARSLDSDVRTVALCAGSGSSVLRDVQADLYLTGEMSHHDVLDAVADGTSVILCEHSNTERGFLYKFKELLYKELKSENIQIYVSTIDKDPLSVV